VAEAEIDASRISGRTILAVSPTPRRIAFLGGTLARLADAGRASCCCARRGARAAR